MTATIALPEAGTLQIHGRVGCEVFLRQLLVYPAHIPVVHRLIPFIVCVLFLGVMVSPAAGAVEDEIVVIYKPATSVGSQAKARAQSEVVVTKRLRGFGSRGLQVVESSTDENRRQTIQRLEREPAVLMALPNFLLTRHATNDPRWGE